MTDIVEVCVGRCARVSYLTHDGKRDPQADVQLFERLLSGGHMSPMEHAARPFDSSSDPRFTGNFVGWMQARKMVANDGNFLLVDRSKPFELW